MAILEAKWYVIQVVSWTEENVKQSLMQRRERFSLEEYIIDVFVPTHDIVSLRANWDKVKKKKNKDALIIMFHFWGKKSL